MLKNSFPIVSTPLIAFQTTFFLLSSLLTSLAGEIIPILTTPSSGIHFEATQGYFPPRGYLPLHIKITNHSGEPQSWKFDSTSHSTQHHRYNKQFHFTKTLTAPEGKSTSYELLVPLAPRGRSPSSQNLVQFSIQGYGITPTDPSTFSSPYANEKKTPYLLMGKQLAPHAWKALAQQIKNTFSAALDGAKIEPSDFPHEWRAYWGVDFICLSEQEWKQLHPQQQTAIADWVAQGGTCLLYTPLHSSSTPTPQQTFLPKVSTQSYGFGEWIYQPWEENYFPLEPLYHLLTSPLAPSSSSSSWGLAHHLEGISTPLPLVLTFVLLFALLIGPINLFFFAREPHRYRLFWTTPSLSLAASLALILIIFITEGWGGTGYRMVLSYLLPEEKKIILIQEQISRSAVLGKTSFSLEEPAILEPLFFDSSKIKHYQPNGTLSALFSAAQSQKDSMDFFENGLYYSGDYFRTRAVQAQILATLRPTRATIQWLPEASPSRPIILSTFPTPLDLFFWIDSQGHAWQAKQVHPDAPTLLEPSSSQTFLEFWEKQIALAGDSIQPRLQTVANRRNHFFAISHHTSYEVIPTLESLHWNTHSTLYLGPLALP